MTINDFLGGIFSPSEPFVLLKRLYVVTLPTLLLLLKQFQLKMEETWNLLFHLHFLKNSPILFLVL